MLNKAIELGRLIAPYCFFANFLEESDPERDYTENKIMFYSVARHYVLNYPGTALADALTYRGRLWRLSHNAPKYDPCIPVSWSSTDWMFQEYGAQHGLTKIIADTGDDFGISVEGLALYMKGNGVDIFDIKYWTGITTGEFFDEHPSVNCVIPVWDAEGEVIYPLSKDHVISTAFVGAEE